METPKLTIDVLSDKLTGEIAHAKKYPGAPVSGCVSVMPMLDEKDIITMQFNGFCIILAQDGRWVFQDTAKLAAGDISQ